MRIPTASRRQTSSPEMQEVCGTADSEIGWGYVKQLEIVSDDRSTRRNGLGLSEKVGSIRGLVSIGEM